MIQLKGQIQLSEFKAAQKLHAQQGGLFKWAAYLVMGIVFLVAVGTVIQSLLSMTFWELLLVAVVAGGVWALLRIVPRPRQLERLYAQQKELSMPFEMEFSDEAFHFRNEHSNSRLPWQVFIKWKENGELFLLYQSDISFNMVPKRLFQNESDIEYVRERLRAHAVPDVSSHQKSLRLPLVAILVIVAIVVVIVSYFAQSAAK